MYRLTSSSATPVIEDDDSYLMCTMTDDDSGRHIKQHSVWLDMKSLAGTAEGKHFLFLKTLFVNKLLTCEHTVSSSRWW